MDILLHIANVLLLLSFTLKDVMWLRLLNVCASGFFVTFFWMQPKPMWSAMGWNVLFTTVNLYQIWQLWLERRPVFLAEREQQLYDLVFSSLTPREFVRLLQHAEWHETKVETVVIEHGSHLQDMMLIVSGGMSVQVGGQEVVTLRAGQFVGEMSFLTDEAASADVVATEGTVYLAWQKQTLRVFLDKHPGICACVQLVIGHDLVRKLRTT